MAQEEQQDPFSILGVDVDSSDREVTKAYRKLALEKHPDKNLHDPNAGAVFAAIVEAHETLMDPELRKKHESIVKARRERLNKLQHMDQRRREQREELAKREQEEVQRRTQQVHAERVKRQIEIELARVREEIRRQRQIEKQVLENARLATLKKGHSERQNDEDFVPPLPSMELEEYEQVVFAKILKNQ